MKSFNSHILNLSHSPAFLSLQYVECPTADGVWAAVTDVESRAARRGCTAITTTTAGGVFFVHFFRALRAWPRSAVCIARGQREQ